MESTLTGVRDADTEILLRSDYPSILLTCQSDQYLRSICQDQSFWAKKLFYDYGMTSKTRPTFSEEYEYQYYNSLNPNTEAIKGNLSNLIAIWSLTGKLPKQTAVNIISNNGDLRMLKWLAAKGVLPDAIGATFALNRRDWDLLDWLASQKIYPTPDSVSKFILESNLDMVNWLIQRKILPGKTVFDRLKEPKIIDLLIEYGIKPDPVWMAFWGNLYSLKRALEFSKAKPIDLAISAAKGGSINVFEWLASQGYFFDKTVGDLALQYGNTRTAKWLEENKLS